MTKKDSLFAFNDDKRPCLMWRKERASETNTFRGQGKIKGERNTEGESILNGEGVNSGKAKREFRIMKGKALGSAARKMDLLLAEFLLKYL